MSHTVELAFSRASLCSINLQEISHIELVSLLVVVIFVKLRLFRAQSTDELGPWLLEASFFLLLFEEESSPKNMEQTLQYS